jgi:site-specific recombinase XerD
MKHSINLDPDRDTLDGRELSNLVRLWLDHCRSRLPAYTVAGYEDKVSYFVRWWADVGHWLNWEVSEDTLLQFNLWLNTIESRYHRPLSYNSKRDVLRRLRQCLRWAFVRGYTNQRDFSNWVPAADGSAPLRQRVSLDDLGKLMIAADQAVWPERDTAFVALLIGTGMRRAEAVGLDVSDVRIDSDLSGTAVIRHAKRVKGRQQQGRVVAFDSWTGRYLVRLIDVYKDPSSALFLSSPNSSRMSLKTAERIVKRAIHRAGLDGRIQGPHDLRRHFTTWFSLQHADNPFAGRLLSRQLGHSAFAMTSRYILDDAEELRGVIRSPLAGGVSQP